MAKYYLDFVGLNTFIYEMVGHNPDEQEAIKWNPAISTSGRETKTIREDGLLANLPLTLNHFGFIDTSNVYTHTGIKNYLFPKELANTASYFPALMIYRNGPYGHPTWKQIRVGQNPLTRKQVKENIFTFVEEPGSPIIINGSRVNRQFGAIKKFDEVSVVSKFRPLLVRGETTIRTDDTDRLQAFDVRSSYSNGLVFFNNDEVNKFYGLEKDSDEVYDEIKQLYLDGALNSEESPMEVFRFLKYDETIYPAQIYTNKSYTRQRTNFIFNWRDDFDNRKSIASSLVDGTASNGYGAVFPRPMSQSIWPLDFDVAQGESAGSDRFVNSYGLNVSASFSNGILMNNYNQASNYPNRTVAKLNSHLMPAPIYARKHMLTPSASVVSKNGMTIEGINNGTIFGNLDDTQDLPSGEAKWEAGDQSGLNPFYDSYDNYIQGARQRGKGYTIIPEFRISNHISTLVAEGFEKNLTNLFEMTGGLSTADVSDEDNFYKIYSTTDFLKLFDVVKEDHKNFVEPSKIKLKCKVIKKFLPYNGFYPCQRTVQLGEQFHSSYGNSITTTGPASTFGFTGHIAKKNILNPLFGPGVLFNTIKAGVACDYPIVTGSIRTSSNPNDHYIVGNENKIFEKRIPFDALIEPERHLAGIRIFDQEPHPSASTKSSAMWDGEGDNLYKMMTHNFLAEVPSFFLQGEQFSTITSLPSNDPRVGNATSGSTYSMRVKMFKSSHDAIEPIKSGSSDDFFFAPQYADHTRESFTMYSRPTAFGPPSQATSSQSSFINMTGSNSEVGENYPFTPPYYYGQAWADIKFTADSTKKFTIDEIITKSNVTYWRFIHEDLGGGDYIPAVRAAIISDLYNDDAMQLDSSVNLFAQGEVSLVDLESSAASDKVEIVVDVNTKEKSSWIIQPLFETPMLNFNHLSASTSLHLPTHGSQSVPRGMWHQYGRIETDNSKGVFLQTTDIPENFRRLVSGSVNEESLLKLCGFKDIKVKLGKTAQSKVISEAVVAIPFIEEEGERKFFRISDEALQVAKSNILSTTDKENRVGKSILSTIEKMKKFVIPPSLDFYHRKDLEPFAMYIFEFNHTLSQQDLANIWQNLYPEIGRSFQESEVSIEHDAHELLGGGEVIPNEGKLKGPKLPDQIRWIVFKAKQRAETNYFNKIVGESETQTDAIAKAQAASILRPEGYGVDLSFNWPYDFFSLVELVKLDAEVTLSDNEVVKEEVNDVTPKTSEPLIAEESSPQRRRRRRRGLFGRRRNEE